MIVMHATSITEVNIFAICDLIESDKHFILSGIVEEIEIPSRNAQAIILDDLGYQKLSARWVPYHLIENQKVNHLVVCERLLV